MKSCLVNLFWVGYKMVGQKKKKTILEVFIAIMVELGVFKEDNQGRLT